MQVEAYFPKCFNANSWDIKYKNPIGGVVNVIGDVNDSESEMNSIIYNSGFSPFFHSIWWLPALSIIIAPIPISTLSWIVHP